MKKLMSKKVLMGAGVVLVAYLAYKAWKKKADADKLMAERQAVRQEAVASASTRLAGKQASVEAQKEL
jgi:uncharacterized membrane protein YebE (DUF533 family)